MAGKSQGAGLLCHHRLAPLALACLIPSLPALAYAEKETAGFELERHHTDNAHDSIFARPDWYTALRGTVSLARAHETGDISVSIDAETRQYDTVSVQDDTKIGLKAAISHKATERLELRGTMGWSLESEGDVVELGDVILGVRTPTHRLGGEAQAGYTFGNGLTVAVEGSGWRETPGPSLFEAGVLEPALLAPLTDRLSFAGRVAKTGEEWKLAAVFGGERVLAGTEDFTPYGYGLTLLSARAEGEWQPLNALRLSASGGVQQLSVDQSPLREIRPAFAAEIDWKAPGGAELRAAAAGGYDTADGDDPVANWMQRLEFEASAAVAPGFVLAAGVFDQFRKNFTLGYDEHARGIYGQARKALGGRTDLVFRVDLSRTLYSYGAEKQVLDGFVGLSTKL